MVAPVYTSTTVKRIPLSPRPHQHMLSLVFFMAAILADVRWNIKVILIYISLIAKDVKPLKNIYLPTVFFFV